MTKLKSTAGVTLLLVALLAPTGAAALGPRERLLAGGGAEAVVETGPVRTGWLGWLTGWLTALWASENGHIVP